MKFKIEQKAVESFKPVTISITAETLKELSDIHNRLNFSSGLPEAPSGLRDLCMEILDMCNKNDYDIDVNYPGIDVRY